MLKLTPIGKNRMKLLEGYSRKGIEVPSGFVTDGASIPRIFWVFFSPMQYLESAVIHDYAYEVAILYYEKKDYKEAKKWFQKGDKAFLECLKEDDRKIARLFYNAVRVYRWFYFNKAR
jgi:phosphoenolpyruvate synthase/pyruvate phosphate dikinase